MITELSLMRKETQVTRFPEPRCHSDPVNLRHCLFGAAAALVRSPCYIYQNSIIFSYFNLFVSSSFNKLGDLLYFPVLFPFRRREITVSTVLLSILMTIFMCVADNLNVLLDDVLMLRPQISEQNE